MAGDLVTYACADGIASLVMDDGKANVLSPAMQRAIAGALGRAEEDGAVVILTGRPGVFSGGFDLAVLRGGGDDALSMLKGGFELARRLMSFPRPVVIACSGHAVAMGLFLMLAGDYRIGIAGSSKIVANEVAIGLTMPRAAVEICRARLTPAALERGIVLASAFSPDRAVSDGVFDEVVEEAAGNVGLMGRARQVAAELQKLDRTAHLATKLRVREQTLVALDAAIELDDADLRAMIDAAGA